MLKIEQIGEFIWLVEAGGESRRVVYGEFKNSAYVLAWLLFRRCEIPPGIL